MPVGTIDNSNNLRTALGSMFGAGTNPIAVPAQAAPAIDPVALSPEAQTSPAGAPDASLMAQQMNRLQGMAPAGQGAQPGQAGQPGQQGQDSNDDIMLQQLAATITTEKQNEAIMKAEDPQGSQPDDTAKNTLKDEAQDMVQKGFKPQQSTEQAVTQALDGQDPFQGGQQGQQGQGAQQAGGAQQGGGGQKGGGAGDILGQIGKIGKGLLGGGDAKKGAADAGAADAGAADTGGAGDAAAAPTADAGGVGDAGAGIQSLFG